jgi:hypothetical protein
MVFSAQSVQMAAHARVKYVMPSLSNNCTATEKVFSVRSVPGLYKEFYLKVRPDRPTLPGGLSRAPPEGRAL